MDPLFTGLLSLGVIVFLIFLGIPVALSILSVTVVGMYLVAGDAFLFTTLETLPFSTTSSYAFAVIPMFILMGEIAGGARIIGDLYHAIYRWVGGFKSGLYSATILASAGFAAISGSTVVNAAVFTRVALPEIVRLGYDRGFGAGSIAASGALAAMIPPSISIVLYGILTGESVGTMLIAGVVPGLLTAGALLLCALLMVRFRPQLGPKKVETFTFKEKCTSLLDIWPAMLLASVVLGGIYTGTFSPSAAGTVGALGAVLIALLKGRMTKKLLFTSLRQTAITSAVLFFILIAGLMLARFLLFSGSVGALTDTLSSGTMAPVLFMAALVCVYFFLGMFIDPISMMVITVPFIYPTIQSMGFDTIWFGIIIVKLVEIAAITPPVGINLFAVMASSDGQVTARNMFVGILPFVVAEIIVLIILLLFPAITTTLPSLM